MIRQVKIKQAAISFGYIQAELDRGRIKVIVTNVIHVYTNFNDMSILLLIYPAYLIHLLPQLCNGTLSP